MKLLVVDDEMIALRGTVRLLGKLYPDAEIIGASGAQEALSLFGEDIDVAFLDVELPEMNGLELGAQLLEQKKNLNIIYITAYSEYALDAYRIHASGYLTKPIDDKQVTKEMENLRYPITEAQKKLKVRCFGNFDVFVDGMPIHFPRSRSREVLAYMIDRKGAAVTIEELCSALWNNEGDPDKVKISIQTLIKTLRKTLDENGMADVLVCRRNSYAVNPAMLDCDYYTYLANPEGEKNLFRGEYMSQYKWAKRTLDNME